MINSFTSWCRGGRKSARSGKSGLELLARSIPRGERSSFRGTGSGLRGSVLRRSGQASSVVPSREIFFLGDGPSRPERVLEGVVEACMEM